MLRFDHINIFKENVQELIDFYEGLLGMQCQSVGFGENNGYKVGNDDGGNIVFWKPEGIYGVNTKTEIVFKTDNIDKTYADLYAKNKSIQKPYIAAWGGKEMKMQDPAGNTVYIIEN